MCRQEKLNLLVYYTLLYSTMSFPELNYNQCLRFLIENSILTSRQISIISKRIRNDHSPDYRTAGSYYRQVKQCRMKIKRIIYTIILLRVLDVMDDNINESLEQIVIRLNELVKLSDHRDISHVTYQESDLLSMLSMLNDVITKLIKV
jgi:hypothetical protein